MSSQLDTWLENIASLHPREIDLSLERVSRICERLELNQLGCPVIVVGGTNGKGSTVHFIEKIYHAAGYRVGTYTSPHLLYFNERIKINLDAVADQVLIDAFEHIETYRKQEDITLTFFEFTTLAALYVFKKQQLDIIILEVGLGGRLDATNVIDASVAVITSISLDHTDRLGPTVQDIAYEKAGIARPNTPAVVTKSAHQNTGLLSHLATIAADIHREGVEYKFELLGNDNWSWMSSSGKAYQNLPKPHSAHIANFAAALQAVVSVDESLPITEDNIRFALDNFYLPGRIQQLQRQPEVILDVGHNVEAITSLASYLEQNPVPGKTIAIFAMLIDKDILGCVRCIMSCIDTWRVAPLKVPRGANAEVLSEVLLSVGQKNTIYKSVREAYESVLAELSKDDRLVVFGSFYTVADILKEECVKA